MVTRSRQGISKLVLVLWSTNLHSEKKEGRYNETGTILPLPLFYLHKIRITGRKRSMKTYR